MLSTAASSVNSAPLTFEFSVVDDNSLRFFFAGRSIDEPYSGTFTIDSAAPVKLFNGSTAYEEGFFDVTTEILANPNL